jgi:hypothetical protein
MLPFIFQLLVALDIQATSFQSSHGLSFVSVLCVLLEGHQTLDLGFAVIHLILIDYILKEYFQTRS